MASSARSRTTRVAAFIAFAVVSACVDPVDTEAPDPVLRAGKGAGGGGSTATGPTVTSTSPNSSVRNVTLDVRVLGSGFDQGTSAQWAIDGVPSSKVMTNSTRYVSSTEVVANITVAADADVTLYDVIVTTSSGKPGIGTEEFEVVIEQSQLPTLGGSSGDAYEVNDQGVIVGTATDRSADRNGTRYPVRWDFVGGKWTITRLAAVASKDAVARDVNNSNWIVGFSEGRAKVWLPGGSTVDLGPGCAMGINSAGTVIGVLVTSDGQQGVVWTRNGSGWNAPQILPKSLLPASFGAWPVCGYEQLKDINDSGTIVGVTPALGDQPTAWVPATSVGPWGEPVFPAGGPAGAYVNGGARVINESGVIVATTQPDFTPRLLLADGTEQPVSKSGPAWPAGFSFGINKAGDIVARDNGMGVWLLHRGASQWTKLHRTFGGEVRDISDAIAGQPMRIVGRLSGKPTVWTLR